ncbi:MAG: hypothetical protein KDA80_05060 [Planctomycetaceae bacterium]|nr:hypothetical protein [Planctomycetaceae bacterium]
MVRTNLGKPCKFWTGIQGFEQANDTADEEICQPWRAKLNLNEENQRLDDTNGRMLMSLHCKKTIHFG